MCLALELSLGWPLTEDLTDQALQTMLQPPRQNTTTAELVEPDVDTTGKELSYKGMTLLLWEEYIEANPHH